VGETAYLAWEGNMSEIVFDLPTADTPGYLKRQRAAVALQGELAKNPTPAAVDGLVEFLLDYVKEPADREAAREAVWMLPQARLEEVIKSLVTSQTAPKVSGPSATGPAETEA